ncbi:MAG TPA: SEC-C metal-binding domain-containing protein [Syntrophomonadaceae bacterium]|nr:SEC-C metal-binding domain-containing protein [Syntrophomonadaceae bacterium]
MGGLKVGRNDPCPCGSGKKYKKCCGAISDLLDISSDPFSRYSQLLAAVKLRLDQHYGSRIRKLRRDLQERFQHFATQAVLAPENESLFSEWLWFAYPLAGSLSLGREYLEEHGEFMEPALRNCLAALNNSYISIYEVLSSQDNVLELRDIFLRKPVSVLLKEPWDAELEQDHPLLMGRLVTLEKHQLFSGMVQLVQRKPWAASFLQEHLDFLAVLWGQEEKEFLSAHQEMVYGLFDHVLTEKPLLFDHMETAEVDDQQKTALKSFLEQKAQWLHHTAGHDWFQLPGETQGYVRIALGEEQLVWSAQVLKDITFVRDLLGSSVPEIQSQVINNRLLDQPPQTDAFSYWFLMVKDRESEQWLETPHEELDGQTPAQVLSQDGGRTYLQAMLESFQAADASPEGQLLIEYMQERISQ